MGIKGNIKPVVSEKMVSTGRRFDDATAQLLHGHRSGVGSDRGSEEREVDGGAEFFYGS